MTIEQFNLLLSQYEPPDPTPLCDAVQELEQISIAAGDEAKKASDAYFADARARESLIKARIAELIKNRDALQTKIEAFKKPLVAATVTKDNSKLSEIKEHMKALEADRRQITDEIEMLQGAHVTGDPELYDDAVEKNARFLEAKEQYIEARGALFDIAAEQERIYSRIKGAYSMPGPYAALAEDTRGGRGPDMEELSDHYHAKDLSTAHEEV